MKDLSPLLIAVLGRLGRAVTNFITEQLRPQQTVWIGTQAYTNATPPSQHPAIPLPTWHLLTERLTRLTNRLATLFAQYQQGTLPTPRPARAQTARPAAPYQRLPTTPGWINLRIPEAAPCGGNLEILLHTQEMRDFATAAPQAARLLRPLCRMLGLTPPDYLHLPPRPKRPASLPSPRAFRGEPEGGSPANAPPRAPDRPLPAYVRAAARAWKKYDR